MFKSLAALSAVAVTSFGVSQADLDLLVGAASEVSATASIRAVFQVAAADTLLAGVPFEDALAAAVASTDSAAMSNEGSTVRWRNGALCFESTFVDPLVWDEPDPCLAG